jgi:hypothetical protein
MRSLTPQQVDQRALIQRLALDLFRNPLIVAQQARLDALIHAPEREYAASQPQQHNNGST